MSLRRLCASMAMHRKPSRARPADFSVVTTDHASTQHKSIHVSFGWTVAGTVGQLMLGYFLFMLVVFSACGLGDGPRLGRLARAILDRSMYVVPGLCPLSAAIVIVLHRLGDGPASYLWYAMPLGGAALYLGYFAALVRHGRNRSGSAPE